MDKCLAAVKKADKNNKLEIIVVDTGSTDNSIEIAKKYTDKVYEFVWCDDFSAARNYSIEKATGDYIFVIDSDEIIEKLNIEKLEKLAVKHMGEVGRIERINEFTRNGEKVRFTERISRLFAKDLFCYKGRIHEQVTPKNIVSTNASVTKMYDAPVTIMHGGYEGSLEDRKRKAERNRQLLLKDLEEFGDDPYTLYQLGKCYYMEEQYLEACEYFGRGLGFDLSPKLEYVQDMVESYGYALVNSKNAEIARDILGEKEVYEAFSQSGDFCFMMGLVYMNCQEFERAVDEFLKAVKKPAKVEGVNSYKAYYNVGVIYECLGDKEMAMDLYKKCGSYEPAVKQAMVLTKNK